MPNNSHQPVSGLTSPSVGYNRHGSETAQQSQHDDSQDTYPPTSQPESTAVTEQSDRDLPTDAEEAVCARTIAAATLDDIAETRRELLDRLART